MEKPIRGQRAKTNPIDDFLSDVDYDELSKLLNNLQVEKHRRIIQMSDDRALILESKEEAAT